MKKIGIFAALAAAMASMLPFGKPQAAPQPAFQTFQANPYASSHSPIARPHRVGKRESVKRTRRQMAKASRRINRATR